MIFLPMQDPSSDQLSGLENYLFDRYMHTLLRIFILLGLSLLPILLPINLGGKSETVGVKGLDRLSFSNVGFSHPYRYWTHLVSAVFVAISVCLILQAELRSYTRPSLLRLAAPSPILSRPHPGGPLPPSQIHYPRLSTIDRYPCPVPPSRVPTTLIPRGRFGMSQDFEANKRLWW